MKTALQAVGLIAVLLGALGLVDAIDRDMDDRLDYRRWVQDSCIPTDPGHSAVLENDGKKLTCTIYSRRGYGLVPAVVSAAVMEIPL